MSFIYKLNPAVKLISIILLTVVVFLVDKIPISVFLLFSFIIFRILARIPFSNFKHIKNLSFLAVFVILVQTIFGPGNTYIIPPLINNMLFLKREGFLLGLVVVCRLFSVFVLYPVLAKTASAKDLALGFCSLGFQYRIAFFITMAFNMLPVFQSEALAITEAQKLRGMRHFEKHGRFSISVFSKLKAYCCLALPLILGAMRKAQISSVAMDSRGFGVYKTRTWLEKPQINKSDFLFLGSCICFSAVVLFFNYYDIPEVPFP